jgi:hypothetical protein
MYFAVKFKKDGTDAAKQQDTKQDPKSSRLAL